MDLLEDGLVRLRALEPEDLELLYRWENDSSQWSVGNTLSPYSRYILREYISQSHRSIYELKQLRLMIEHCVSGEVMGMIDLYDFEPHHSRAGIGILLDPRYQKNGYATHALDMMVGYAFSFLKLHQLYAHVPIKNEPSKSLFMRRGFEISGILKDWIVIKEGYSDVLVMQRFSGETGY